MVRRWREGPAAVRRNGVGRPSSDQVCLGLRGGRPEVQHALITEHAVAEMAIIV